MMGIAKNAAKAAAQLTAVNGMADKSGTQLAVFKRKEALKLTIHFHANQSAPDCEVVSSLAFEALCGDHLRFCSGRQGGLSIVCNRHGTGKSHALQGAAWAKSLQQPGCFLTINILSSAMTCEECHDKIQAQLGVENLGPPQAVADVIQHGLVVQSGPVVNPQRNCLTLATLVAWM